jgi:hypothetical protein
MLITHTFGLRYGRHNYCVTTHYFAASGWACIAKEPELLPVRALYEGSPLPRQQLPSLHHAVRIQRNRRNALLYQPLGKIRVVAGALAADTYVSVLSPAGFGSHYRSPISHKAQNWC